MKKILGLFACCMLAIAFFSCEKKNEFTITGTFADETFDGCTVVLLDLSRGKDISNAVDTTVVQGNQFVFKGISPDTVAIYYANVELVNSDYYPIIPEKGNIILNVAESGDYTVSGTKTNDEYQEYRNSITSMEEQA
ncbi:DUF4369 domain-containing protein, partial [Bacteroidales bacterium OttesenSCG-928-M11]|nr:DUF4369 domain-containing protein [Bacteroidales bacterium OttesenSCG-928-M11]